MVFALLVCASSADEAQAQPPAVPRAPWTSSRVQGSPDPPPPYHTENAFPHLQFRTPTEITAVPGCNRLVVAEMEGKIFAFPNDPAVTTADLLIDLNTSIYGVTFHPRFLDNGFMYVVNVHDKAGVLQVSRFVVERGRQWRCPPASAAVIFRWPAGKAGGHKGGALRFGPDGYLYIGTGDGDQATDSQETGQDVGDVLGSILRIDVDRPLKYKRYGIPPDNPFVRVAGARPEIWAYGIRQPWKMNFDRANGDLWVGEVGQDLWESVLRVERGGNYGWSVVEGGQPSRPDRRRGPTPILPPVVSHPHSEFRALIGGGVYHGTKLPELTGCYLYGDHETGKIRGLRFDGARVTWSQELAATRLRIIGFAEDDRGDFLILDYLDGAIHRLVAGPAAVQNLAFPKRLSETGLFASVPDHRPAPGVIPYSVNAALWSDGAFKERFLALPATSRINFDTVANRFLVVAPPGWGFPDGTVLVKTFSLEMEAGNPASRRRIETRLLHLQKLGDTDELRDQHWRGYSYAWNAAQSDAVLVEAAGRDVIYTIRDPRAQPAGGARQQTWHFPSRTQCILCHSTSAKFVLGVNTLQMNKEIEVDGRKRNQLFHLEQLGFFSSPLPPLQRLGRLVDYEDEHWPINDRARSYLHANCAHCHMKFGGGNSPFQLQANLPLADTGTVDVVPVHAAFDIPEARLLAPGKPERSILHERMARLGGGRMPPLASAVVDKVGTKLIADWIEQVPAESANGSALWAGSALSGIGTALFAGAWFWTKRAKSAKRRAALA